MVNRIFWKTTPVRRFTGSATSSSLEFPLPLQKREYKTNKVFELFSHSRKYCVCGYPRMVDAKKKCTPRRKFTCNLKSNPLKKANHLPNLHLGVPCFFQGCIMFGATFSSISVRVSRYRRVSPRGVTFAFFRVSGASSISQPLGLCTTKTPSKSFKLLKFLCWFDGFAMLCS